MHSITNSTLFVYSVFMFSACVCGLAAGLTVAWEEDDQFQGNMISVPPEIYTKGCVRDVDDGLAVSMSGQSHHNILTFAFVYHSLSQNNLLAKLHFMWCFFAVG